MRSSVRCSVASTHTLGSLRSSLEVVRSRRPLVCDATLHTLVLCPLPSRHVFKPSLTYLNIMLSPSLLSSELTDCRRLDLLSLVLLSISFSPFRPSLPRYDTPSNPSHPTFMAQLIHATIVVGVSVCIITRLPKHNYRLV